MAKLRFNTKEEYQKWLAQNPGVYHTANGVAVGAPSTRQTVGSGNPISNLLRSVVVDPFARMAESGGALANRALNTVFNEKINTGPVLGNYFGEKEQERIKKNPLLELSKGAAGAAALGVGGGAATSSLKGAIGSGALGGGLGSLGTSEGETLGESAEDAIKGGVLGGITGGALYGVGKGLSAIKGGQKVNPKLIKGKASKVYMTPEEFTRTRTNVLQQMDDMKLSIKNSKDIANNYPLLVEKLGKDKAKFLQQFGDEIFDTNSLRNIIAENPEVFAQKPSKTSRYLQRKMDEILGPGGQTDLRRLDEFKSFLDNDIFKNFDDLVKDTGSPEKKVFQDLRSATRDLIAKNDAADSILNNFHDTLQLKDIILKNPEIATKPASIPLVNVRPNLRGPEDFLKSGGIGRGVAKGTSPLGNLAMKGAGKAGALTGMMSTQGAPAPAVETGGVTQQPGAMGSGGQTINKDALAQMVMSGQLSAAEAKLLMDLYGGGEEEEGGVLVNNKDAATALQMLESGVVSSGKLKAIGSGFGEFFGTQDPQTTQFKAVIDRVRNDILHEMAGTARTAQEIKSLKGLLPEYSDEPKILMEKLRALASDGTMRDYGSAESIDEQYTY